MIVVGGVKSNQASIILKKCTDIELITWCMRDGWNMAQYFYTSPLRLGPGTLWFLPEEKGFTTPRIIEATHSLPWMCVSVREQMR